MVASLSESARQLIEREMDNIFDRLLFSFLGPTTPSILNKEIVISARYNPQLSIPGLYFSSMEASGKPAEALNTLRSSIRIASNYLDSLRNTATARVINTVEAQLGNFDTGFSEEDFKSSLEEALIETLDSVKKELKTIAASEATKAKNLGSLESISRVASDMGVSDPNVYFSVLRDGKACSECKRLHLLEDLKTPRVYKMSEVKHSYHKKGQNNPSVSGLHPHCRCFFNLLSMGFGFTEEGKIKYVTPNYDEWKEQRSK